LAVGPNEDYLSSSSSSSSSAPRIRNSESCLIMYLRTTDRQRTRQSSKKMRKGKQENEGSANSEHQS
jgi:hypothetical protein